MVLTNKEKAVIENDFNEKGWNAYKIWKEHPSFECSWMAVHNLIKKIKETGLTEHCKGSGWPVTATTEENKLIFEELVCSQEDELGTHNSIRQIAPRILISKSWVHRLVKKKNLHCFKPTNLHLRWIQHAVREEPNVLENFFNVFPSTLYHGPCLKMRRTFPFKYQLIAKTIKFISMVPRKICNRNACTTKETSFQKRLWYPLW